MKKIVEVEEKSGLESLLGEKVTLFCARYIYAGRLTGINDTCVLLDDAEIVYETGAFDKKTWQTSEKLPKSWYVRLDFIESFGLLK